MNLLITVFLKLNNEKVYYPNAILSRKPISNYYRRPDMKDTVEFPIDFFTSSKIKSRSELLMRLFIFSPEVNTFFMVIVFSFLFSFLICFCLFRYIENNPNIWHPTHSVVVLEVCCGIIHQLYIYQLYTSISSQVSALYSSALHLN